MHTVMSLAIVGLVIRGGSSITSPASAPQPTLLPTSENSVISEDPNQTTFVPGSETTVIVPDDTSSPTEALEETTSESEITEDLSTIAENPESTTAGDSTTDADSSPTEASTTSPTSTSSSEPVPVDLDEASLVENAEFGKVDGKAAIVLNPPAWGQASFRVPATVPDDLVSGENVKLYAKCLIGNDIGSNYHVLLKQDAAASYTFTASVDGAAAYDETLTSAAGETIDIASNPVPASKKPEVGMSVKSGEKPVRVSIYDISIAAEDNLGSGSPDSDGDGAGNTNEGSGDGDISSTASGSPTGGPNGSDDDNLADSAFHRRGLTSCIISLIASLFSLAI